MNRELDDYKQINNPTRLNLYITAPTVCILGYLIGAGLEFLFPVKFISPGFTTFIRITGLVVFFTGALFASWSSIVFHQIKITKAPGEISAELVTWGPYRFSRNPMYISLILIYLSEAGILAHLMPILTLPLVIAYINRFIIPLEEALLKETFGTKYEDYTASVPRWL